VNDISCMRGQARCSTITLLMMAGLLLIGFFGKSMADGITDNRIFDITSDVDFKNYKNVLELYARKHRPGASNDFCIIGYVAEDNSKLAWIVWRQGREIILWEGSEMNLDFSRRKIDLRKDVVKTDKDLHGSTYLVTQAWVDELTGACSQVGTKLHVGKR